jgi:hypothetical protein
MSQTNQFEPQEREKNSFIGNPVIGVNGSRQALSSPGAGVVGQLQAALGHSDRLPMGSILSSPESVDVSQVRDRPNDIYSLGSTHQPTLVKPMSSVQMQMPAGMPPMHPGWQQAMSERVMWATNQQVQTATMQLDPPELGALQVKLHIFQEQVSVTFTSPHANVRDAVEQSLPRLREMLAEQGMDLGESLVNDQSSDQRRQQGDMASGSDYPPTSDQGVDELPEKSNVGLSLVDYYA